MKTIKVRFEGFWPGFEPEDFCIYQILRKHYIVEISDDPDYVICSLFRYHDYVDYPQIRILFSGENYIPDFNLVDYAVSVYPLELMDRHFSFPGLVDRMDHFLELQNKDRNYLASIVQEKTLFANSIASHNSDNGIRGALVEQLSQYKRVECPGRFLYNMPNGETVKREDGSKRALQKKCKFTLCCESTCEGGFITEKIYEAFCADTIPVYYGGSNICDTFNKDAFINISDYKDLQQVVERIIELDQDDEKYLNMLRQPIFTQPEYIKNQISAFERFICHIFDQPLEQVRRRPLSYTPKEYEQIVSKGRVRFLQDRDEQKRRELKARKKGQTILRMKVWLYPILSPLIKKIGFFKKKTGNERS